MSLCMTDNGNGMVSFRAIGSVIRTGIVRQSINKKTGKMSEYVEIVVAYRPKQYENDLSCSINLRVYGKALSALAMKLKKGWQVAVDGNTNPSLVDAHYAEHKTLLGYATMISPVFLLSEMFMEWMERYDYTKELTRRSYEINYGGGMDTGTENADF